MPKLPDAVANNNNIWQIQYRTPILHKPNAFSHVCPQTGYYPPQYVSYDVEHCSGNHKTLCSVLSADKSSSALYRRQEVPTHSLSDCIQSDNISPPAQSPCAWRHRNPNYYRLLLFPDYKVLLLDKLLRLHDTMNPDFCNDKYTPPGLRSQPNALLL